MVVSVLIPELGGREDVEMLPVGTDPSDVLQGPVHYLSVAGASNSQLFWSSSSYHHSKVNELASSIAGQLVKGDVVIRISHSPLLDCDNVLNASLVGHDPLASHLRGAYHLQHDCHKGRSSIHVAPKLLSQHGTSEVAPTVGGGGGGDDDGDGEKLIRDTPMSGPAVNDHVPSAAHATASASSACALGAASAAPASPPTAAPLLHAVSLEGETAVYSPANGKQLVVEEATRELAAVEKACGTGCVRRQWTKEFVPSIAATAGGIQSIAPSGDTSPIVADSGKLPVGGPASSVGPPQELSSVRTQAVQASETNQETATRKSVDVSNLLLLRGGRGLKHTNYKNRSFDESAKVDGWSLKHGAAVRGADSLHVPHPHQRSANQGAQQLQPQPHQGTQPQQQGAQPQQQQQQQQQQQGTQPQQQPQPHSRSMDQGVQLLQLHPNGSTEQSMRQLYHPVHGNLEEDAPHHPPPWQDLPSGILGLICLQLPHVASSALLLSHVCKSWRQDILSDSALLSLMSFRIPDVRNPLARRFSTCSSTIVPPASVQPAGMPSSSMPSINMPATNMPATSMPAICVEPISEPMGGAPDPSKASPPILGLSYWGSEAAEPSGYSLGHGALAVGGGSAAPELDEPDGNDQHEEFNAPPCLWLRSTLRTAPKLFLQAAKQGNLSAMVTLAQLLEISGKGEESMKYWKRSAKAGNLEAQIKVGLASYEGVKGMMQDSQNAYFWLNKALRQATAMYPAAHTNQQLSAQDVDHETGDFLELARLLEMKRMVARGALIMGYMYFDGEGVESLPWNSGNREDAVRMFKLAASYGCREGQRALGWMFNTGQYG